MTESENKDLQAFGKRVRLLRKERKLTQKQLGDKAGLTERAIGSIEQAQRWAKLTTLHKLSKALGVSTSDLFTGLK